MCLAIPGKVIKVEGKKVFVEYPGETREVIGGGIAVKAGDYVMVQMGIIIKKISTKEAKIAIKSWKN